MKILVFDSPLLGRKWPHPWGHIFYIGKHKTSFCLKPLGLVVLSSEPLTSLAENGPAMKVTCFT